MPIDRSYRSHWGIFGSHAGHTIWKPDEASSRTIHGTRVGVQIDLCTGCLKCISVCPVDVFKPWTAQGGRRVVDPVGETGCILCLVCESVCPPDAIDILQEEGSEATLNSLLEGSH